MLHPYSLTRKHQHRMERSFTGKDGVKTWVQILHSCKKAEHVRMCSCNICCLRGRVGSFWDFLGAILACHLKGIINDDNAGHPIFSSGFYWEIYVPTHTLHTYIHTYVHTYHNHTYIHAHTLYIHMYMNHTCTNTCKSHIGQHIWIAPCNLPIIFTSWTLASNYSAAF